MSVVPSSAVSTGPVTVWTCGTVPPGGDGLWGASDRAHIQALIMHSLSAALDAGTGRRGSPVALAAPRPSSGRAGRSPGPAGSEVGRLFRDAHPRLHAFRMLFLVAVPLAGLLTAGLLVPWIVGPGLIASSSANLLAPLPGVLSDATPPGNTVVMAGDGSLLTFFYRHNRTPVATDQISEVMRQAIVDIEDSRFYEHHGLDIEGTARALVRNVVAGEVMEGGSTITQQLVKQTLLQSATTEEERAAAVESSVGRKLREARLALAVEEQYSKAEILTRYLNLVYFGEGSYGIQAAAQRYFSVNAADLTLPQAATLAGLVQTPSRDDPIADPERAQVRRNQVLERMVALKHADPGEVAATLPTPVGVAPSAPPVNGCVAAVRGGFFCDYLQRHLTQTLGITQEQLET